MLGSIVRQCSSKKFTPSNQQRERGAELDYWGAMGGVAVWSLSYLDENRTTCQSLMKITISVMSKMKCPSKMLPRIPTNATIASFQHIISQVWKCTWEDIIQKSSSNVTSATMEEISKPYWTLIFEVPTTSYGITVNCVNIKLVKRAILKPMSNKNMKE